MGNLPQDGKSANDEIFTKPVLKRADIAPALKFTLVNEGGYADVPEDRGGPTNFGITQADFTEYLGHTASADDVKKMTVDQAKEIYRKNFWDVMKLGELMDQNIATVIFDMGVLCGVRTSVKWAQEICGVAIDGLMGPLSISSINSQDRTSFITKFANRAMSYLNAVIANRPNQKRFLSGWTERTNRLRSLAKADTIAAPAKPSSSSGYYEKLQELANQAGCPKLGARLVYGIKLHADGHEPHFNTIFDVSKNADAKRLHVLDVNSMTVTSITCGVGSGSDPSNTGMLQKFSNVSGSNCTSEGFFRYGETYSGKHGLSVRMDGKDSTNSNMRSRDVVTHTAPYISDAHAGRSNGCLAVAENHHDLILKLANGSFGVIGKEA